MARSADHILDPDGRQYHIGLKAGEVAPRVLLVGDPARADRVASRFENVRLTRRHREYVTHTGTWCGLDVTVMATGIGCDNTEIAVLELLQCERKPVLVRVGSCGALQPGVQPGDVAISTGALRLEATSAGFVEDAFPAVAHHEVVLAQLSAAAHLGVRHHLGLTATAAGFYGWQGRTEGVIPSRMPDLPERLAAQGVLNLEMEASTLFVLAQLAQVRAGAVCAVFANRRANAFIADDEKGAAEDRAISVGLTTLLFLEQMDRRRPGGHFVLEHP
ncbi:MAG TPA: nucleoside phosphorylase [Planctomycetota bacterium]|nr:nucleoside phosphorylase [Planctomycetota bacterium]